MYVVIDARTSRMSLIDCLRIALRKRGYVEADDPRRHDVLHLNVWGTRDGAAFSTYARWLGTEMFAMLADRTIEGRGCVVEVRGDAVELAEIMTVSSGDVRVDSYEEDADEILTDWCDGGPVYDSAESEYALAYALLEMHEPHGEIERLAFARDRTLPVEPPRPAAPIVVEPVMGPWKRFVHPDGRRWSVRERGGGYDIEIVDADGDTFTKSRSHEHPRGAIALLIVDQLSAGFLDAPQE